MSRTALKLIEAAAGTGGAIPLLLGKVNTHPNVDGWMFSVQKGLDDSTWVLWHFEADNDTGLAAFDAEGSVLISKHINDPYYNIGPSITPYSDRVLFGYYSGLMNMDTTNPVSDNRYRQIRTSAAWGGTVPSLYSVLGNTALFASQAYSNGLSTSTTSNCFHYVDLTSTATVIHQGATFPESVGSSLGNYPRMILTNDGTNFFLVGNASEKVYTIRPSNVSSSLNVLSSHTLSLNLTTSGGDKSHVAIAADSNSLYYNFSAFVNQSVSTRFGHGLFSLDKNSNTVNWAYSYDIANATSNNLTLSAPSDYAPYMWVTEDGNILLYRICNSSTLVYFGGQGHLLVGTLTCIDSTTGDVKWANALYMSGSVEDIYFLQYGRTINKSDTHLFVPRGFNTYVGLPVDGSGAGTYPSSDPNNPTGLNIHIEELNPASITKTVFSSSLYTWSYFNGSSAYYDGTAASGSSLLLQDFTTTFTPVLTESEI